MKVSVIAAVSLNGIIGKGDTLPWRLPDDLRDFRRKTMDRHVIVGRRTYQGIGRLLRGRKPIVLTRGGGDVELVHGATTAPSLEAALEMARGAGEEEVIVIGGAEVYKLALPVADRLYLTRVHTTAEGDVRFPEWDETEWEEVSRENHPQDENHPHSFSICVLERKRSNGQKAAEAATNSNG